MKVRAGHILAGCALAATLQASAAEYLIASLVGDRVTVAQAVLTTGRTSSNLDENDYQVLPMPQLPFDDTIQGAVAGAISKADSKATFKGLAFREGLPGVDLVKEKPAEVAAKLARSLAPMVKPGEKQWIVAVLPQGDEAQMRLASNSRIGHGKVAGLGYYVDRTTNITRGAQTAKGFLGAFANFTVAIIDPASGAIVARQEVQEGEARPVAGTGERHAWDVISADEKVAWMNAILAREVGRAMPEVLAKAGVR